MSKMIAALHVLSELMPLFGSVFLFILLKKKKVKRMQFAFLKNEMFELPQLCAHHSYTPYPGC